MKVIGVLCALMSTFIVWSEVTFFSVSPTLSLAAIFVHLAAKDSSYDYIEVTKGFGLSNQISPVNFCCFEALFDGNNPLYVRLRLLYSIPY